MGTEEKKGTLTPIRKLTERIGLYPFSLGLTELSNQERLVKLVSNSSVGLVRALSPERFSHLTKFAQLVSSGAEAESLASKDLQPRALFHTQQVAPFFHIQIPLRSSLLPR